MSIGFIVQFAMCAVSDIAIFTLARLIFFCDSCDSNMLQLIISGISFAQNLFSEGATCWALEQNFRWDSVGSS